MLRVEESESARNNTIYYVKNLIPGTYILTELPKDANGTFWYDLTITDLTPYVDAFQTKYSPDKSKVYELDTEKNLATYSYKLSYKATGTVVDYKQDGSGWTVDASSWNNNKEQWNGKYLYVTAAGFSSVTYTDGVDGSIFADQVYAKVKNGTATPAFNGDLTREGYVFTGWVPEVAATVNGDATYTAKWGEDKNGNGFPDDLEDKFIVTYTDGVSGEAFEHQGVFLSAERPGYPRLQWHPRPQGLRVHGLESCRDRQSFRIRDLHRPVGTGREWQRHSRQGRRALFRHLHRRRKRRSFC